MELEWIFLDMNNTLKSNTKIATCTFEILRENTNRRAMVVGVYDDWGKTHLLVFFLNLVPKLFSEVSTRSCEK